MDGRYLKGTALGGKTGPLGTAVEKDTPNERSVNKRKQRNKRCGNQFQREAPILLFQVVSRLPWGKLWQEGGGGRRGCSAGGFDLTFRGSFETTMGKTSPTGTNLMLAMIIRQAAPHMLSIVRPSFSFCRGTKTKGIVVQPQKRSVTSGAQCSFISNNKLMIQLSLLMQPRTE